MGEIVKNFQDKRKTVHIYMASQASVKRAWSRYPEISTAYVTKTGQIELSSEQVEFFTEKIKTRLLFFN